MMDWKFFTQLGPKYCKFPTMNSSNVYKTTCLSNYRQVLKGRSPKTIFSHHRLLEECSSEMQARHSNLLVHGKIVMVHSIPEYSQHVHNSYKQRLYNGVCLKNILRMWICRFLYYQIKFMCQHVPTSIYISVKFPERAFNTESCASQKQVHIV